MTRYWLAALIVTGCLANFGLISPAYLVVDWDRIIYKFEVRKT